jgi:REP-associated tyrosine transposase
MRDSVCLVIIFRQSFHPYPFIEICNPYVQDGGFAMPSTHLSLHVHVIFSTKHRRPVLKAEWRSRLHAYLGGAIRDVEAVPVVIGGTADHVHLLRGLKATHRIAEVIREIKRGSSNWLKHDLNISGFSWQSGYGAFSVSPSALESVTRYIAQQELHHRRRTFQEEYLEFLTKSRVVFDERFLWDE